MSPSKWILRELAEVPDEAFSAKYLGDGFIVEPSNGEVYSPVNGEGFQAFVVKGQKVKSGELLIKFDLETIKNKVPSMAIIVIFTSGEICEITKNEQIVNNRENDIVNIKLNN